MKGKKLKGIVHKVEVYLSLETLHLQFTHSIFFSSTEKL